MADTRENLPIFAGVWTNLYKLAGVEVGTKLTVENTGTCDLYLAVQSSQPEPDHNAYNILRRTDPRLTNSAGDSGAWAFCNSTNGEVNVSTDGADGFVPVVVTKDNPLSEAEREELYNELEFRQLLLASLCSIDSGIKLLSARFEEAFETEIERGDV